jgi:uncharacterized protein YndB with AHSA1/START domain
MEGLARCGLYVVGPKRYTALVVRNDVRERRSYLWAMKSEQGRMFWNTGIYKEVVANKKIVSTMSFSNENRKTGKQGSDVVWGCKESLEHQTESTFQLSGDIADSPLRCLSPISGTSADCVEIGNHFRGI